MAIGGKIKWFSPDVLATKDVGTSVRMSEKSVKNKTLAIYGVGEEVRFVKVGVSYNTNNRPWKLVIRGYSSNGDGNLYPVVKTPQSKSGVVYLKRKDIVEALAEIMPCGVELLADSDSEIPNFWIIDLITIRQKGGA